MYLFMMLVISFILILLIAMIDRNALRKLSILSRIGIMTYLIGLSLLCTSTIVGEEVVEALEILGVSFLTVTVIAIIVAADNAIDSAGLRKIGNSFWKSTVNMVICLVVAALVNVLGLTIEVAYFTIVAFGGLAAIFLAIAVISLIILIFKILFGKADDDVQSGL